MMMMRREEAEIYLDTITASLSALQANENSGAAIRNIVMIVMMKGR